MAAPLQRPWLATLGALAPALVLLITAGAAGTFQAPLDTRAVLLGWLVLAGLAALAGEGWRDPLDVRRGVWLVPGLVLLLLGSLWASPVPRAGRLAVTLAPLLVLVPAAVARGWSTPSRRQRGLQAVTWVVLLIATLALAQAVADAGSLDGDSWRTIRTALPLGHHNLLALWLVTLLPLVGAVAIAGPRRWLGVLALVVGSVALVATRSLAGAAATATVLAVLAVARWGRRGLLWVAFCGTVFLLWQGPRLEQIALGTDDSTSVRLTYWQAGIDGVLKRPWLGWGPGSTAWTLAQHLDPIPGVHPPHDVVADLHCLPLQLAYELGLPATVLLVVLFGWFLGLRLLEARRTDDPAGWAGFLGVLGAGVASLGGLPLAVYALPVAVAVAAGASRSAPSSERLTRAPALIALAAVFLALPPGLAQLRYDQAIEGSAGAVASEDRVDAADSTADAAVALRQAIALDPGFPLYRARLAWLEVSQQRGDLDVRRWGARRAQRAADNAFGVASLWLAAGALGQQAGEPWARDALLRACELDPFDPMAPFLLATGGRREPLVEVWAARALLAEPRLLAAEAWAERPAVLRSAVDRVLVTQELDLGWRDALATAEHRVQTLRGARQRLVLSLDSDPAQSPSLYTFRRHPWPARLTEVTLRADAVARINLPPATRLTSTDPRLFEAPMCGL